jgi:hypothetical protein
MRFDIPGVNVSIFGYAVVKWALGKYCRSALPVTLRFQPDVIIHSSPEPLLTAQVSFGRLHRNVPQQELNLLQLAASGMTEASARAANMPHTCHE